MDFAVPSAHTVNVKEGEKLDEYLEFARKLEKLLNIKVAVIPDVVEAIE